MNFYSNRPSVYDIDNMDGHSFEYFCADILKKLGYTKIKVTKASGDNGVDITAYFNGEFYAIQCKRYAKKVGNKAVQEVYAGKDFYNCSKAVVITNNFFTDQAIETARKLGVTLWDRTFLNRMISGAYSNSDLIKKAISKSNYQAKSRKNSSNNNSGCGCLIAIIIALLIFLAMFSNPNGDGEDNKTKTAQSTIITTIKSTTTKSNSGGALGGFDSINRLSIEAHELIY